MCSVGDDNIEDLENLKYMPAKEKPSPFSKCNKCREKDPIVLLRSKDKYCKQCFLAGTVHKFKSLLGKHKLIRPHDQVLIVHRCGHPSTALLHFIRSGLDLETHKKLRFEPVVLFIEDDSNLPLEERRDLLRKVQNEVDKFNFPLYVTTMSMLITMGATDTALKTNFDLLELSDNDRTVVTDFVSKQSNLTNQTDFMHIARQKILKDVARHLKCSFIFTPEISNDVASQLLTDIALGRGSHIALNSGFCDSREESVKILRPLRLFDMKELAFYNYLNNLEPIPVKLPGDNSYKSVQHLIEKFVNGLQLNYPATVTTVLKTGDKLGIGVQKEKCGLCNAPMLDPPPELTSAESTQFSHWISTQVRDESLTTQERYINTLETFNNFNSDTYCFTCRKLIK